MIHLISLKLLPHFWYNCLLFSIQCLVKASLFLVALLGGLLGEADHCTLSCSALYLTLRGELILMRSGLKIGELTEEEELTERVSWDTSLRGVRPEEEEPELVLRSCLGDSKNSE